MIGDHNDGDDGDDCDDDDGLCPKTDRRRLSMISRHPTIRDCMADVDDTSSVIDENYL